MSIKKELLKMGFKEKEAPINTFAYVNGIEKGKVIYRSEPVKEVWLSGKKEECPKLLLVVAQVQKLIDNVK